MKSGLVRTAIAFASTRRLAGRLQTRDHVARWRAMRLQRHFAGALPRVPFYADLRPGRLADLPIVDKAAVMDSFERFNIAGLSLDEARAAIAQGKERIRGLIVGQSTGTSGNRGVFVISERERFTWLGVILAKALPDVLWRRHRVALALPAYNALYASAAATSRLDLRFFDLARGVDAWRDDLRAFGPDTLVAPPKVLRSLAEGGGVAPANVFSSAEVLDPIDRRAVEAAFGRPVREIYMATEGLFGVSCPHGTLHLAEDVVAFEWDRSADAPGLSAPIVTDFTRRTQAMVRYRMNDLLRLSPTPCACGSPLQAVAAIEGRWDDVFELQGGGPKLAMMTPDIVRNAIVDADRRITDYRAVQVAVDRVRLSLPAGLAPEAARAAVAGLAAALARAGAQGVSIDLEAGMEVPYDRKLRRVRRDWRPG